MDVPSHAEIFQTAFPSESVTHQGVLLPMPDV
jgi:hypothetical protein